MSRIEARLNKLEARRPGDTGVRYALVRYAPPAGTTAWVNPMLNRLGWPSSTFALLVIDANDGAPAEPDAVIAPVHYDNMTDDDRARYLAAGRDPGRWFLAVTGRGEAEAMPMPDGQAAFTAKLVAAIHRPQGGYFGGI